MDSPKVTIIIPVFNGSDYLADAIDSAIGQTYENIEILVINDGSNDRGKTEELGHSYGNKIFYYAKDNGGVASALNFGINKATGKYISWLSHDDVYLPNKIKKQIEYIKQNSIHDNEIIFSDWFVSDARLNIIYANIIDGKYRKQPFNAILEHKINGCDMLIPKACFEGGLMFDETLRSTQDYDLWFSMAKKYKFRHIPGFAMISRLHDEQGSRNIDSHDEARDSLHIKFLNELSGEDIIGITKSKAAFYLRRAYKLKSEGISGAADYALELYKKEKQNKPGLISSFFLKCNYNKTFAALSYLCKLFFNPRNWGALFKIIKGRVKSIYN